MSLLQAITSVRNDLDFEIFGGENKLGPFLGVHAWHSRLRIRLQQLWLLLRYGFDPQPSAEV